MYFSGIPHDFIIDIYKVEVVNDPSVNNNKNWIPTYQNKMIIIW